MKMESLSYKGKESEIKKIQNKKCLFTAVKQKKECIICFKAKSGKKDEHKSAQPQP